MEDNRKVSRRTLQRGFECHRLEEELWAMAYEQVCPVIRRAFKRAAKQDQQRGERSIQNMKVSRRA